MFLCSSLVTAADDDDDDDDDDDEYADEYNVAPTAHSLLDSKINICHIN